MQFSKVEISGITTSGIKVLSEKEKTELLKKIREGDLQSRDRLVEGNLKLVLSVVSRFGGRGEDADDLFQIGVIGLIKAIDNFDITQNVRFSTYAVPMIIGEIRRYLRDNSALRVSRSLKDIAYKVLCAKEQFIKEHNREPNITELAEKINVSREDVVQAMEAITSPVSIYEPVYQDGGDTLYLLDQIGDGENDDNWLTEIVIKESITGLSDREKQILSLRFMGGKTQLEVAEEIGISQAQVSRLEKGALLKVKKNL